jgi:hypothetical protein
MIESPRARRVLLVVTGLVFAAIAVGSLVAPATMAEPMRYELGHVDALSEFRAIYVGLWAAHVFACGLAALRIENAALGDVVGVLVLGQGVGRLVSVVLDGPPTQAMWPMLAVELLGGAALLAARPSRRAAS